MITDRTSKNIFHIYISVFNHNFPNGLEMLRVLKFDVVKTVIKEYCQYL